MNNDVGKSSTPPLGKVDGVRRRELLRFGTLASAITGSIALSGFSAGRADAASLQPISEKELAATYVPKWKANNPYAQGEAVLNPAGDMVVAKTVFTSSGTYDAAYWNVPPSIRNAVGADPMHYGASADGDSSLAFQSAMAASRLINLRPGQTYRLTAAVTLPAGTTIEGNGATIQLLAQSHLILNDDCDVRGTRFVNGNTAGFVGGERALTVQGKNVTIERNSFVGQDYRHGIVVERSGGGSCDHCTIRHNTFTNTAYGILKQGGPPTTPTTAHYMKIHDNKFSNIRRGDAIGLNAGSDHDVLIDSNIIDNVTAPAMNFAGFGIAVAGLAGYTAAESDRFRRCVISNNIVTNVEKEGIHAEVASLIEIRGNHVAQVLGTRIGTGLGIVVYGSINCSVTENTVSDFNTGILDGIGFLNGQVIISTDRNKVSGNNVTNCIVGISEGVAGEGKTAFITGNTVTGCPTGIKHFGAASGVYYTGNILLNCATPFAVDANPAMKAAVAATNRRIHFRQNQAYAVDGTTPTNTYMNMTGTAVTAEGNTFAVPL